MCGQAFLINILGYHVRSNHKGSSNLKKYPTKNLLSDLKNSPAVEKKKRKIQENICFRNTYSQTWAPLKFTVYFSIDRSTYSFMSLIIKS